MWSQGWQTAAHPDPHGVTLAAVRHFLQHDSTTSDCGLFFDFASCPQKERDEPEAEAFGRCLDAMGSCYASMCGTTVLLQKHIPARPAEYDGQLMLYEVPAKISQSQLHEVLEKHGEVVSLQLGPASASRPPTFRRWWSGWWPWRHHIDFDEGRRQVFVRYDSQGGAEAAVTFEGGTCQRLTQSLIS